MDQQRKIQLWREYFLQNHHIVFVQNDPDSSVPREAVPQTETSLGHLRPPMSDISESDSLSSDDPPHSSLYARKSAVELFLSDQRNTLSQAHRQEILRVENNWQTEVSRHLRHIEKLLHDISRLERTIVR